jgi:hypothetical protein
MAVAIDTIINKTKNFHPKCGTKNLLLKELTMKATTTKENILTPIGYEYAKSIIKPPHIAHFKTALKSKRAVQIIIKIKTTSGTNPIGKILGKNDI